MVDATVTAEKVAIILQFNLDNDLATTQSGWLDYRSTNYRLVKHDTGVLQAQTDADFTTTVTGIISATGKYFIDMIQFPARWRLALQPKSASTNITINYVLVD